MKTYLKILPALFLLMNQGLFAQLGPGGIPTTNLGMWLRGDALSLSDSDPVGTWADSSPAGNDATQATSANRPSYVAASSINGMPAVQFSGGSDNSTSDFMSVADDDALDNSAGLVFYAALRPTSLGSPGVQGIIGKRTNHTTTANYAYNWFFWTSNAIYYDINTSDNRLNTGATTYSSNNNYIIGTQFDGTLASGSRLRMYTNGSNHTTGTESTTTVINSTENVIIGTMNLNYGQYFAGQIGELMICNAVLTSAQRIIVDNYLAAKYGITLSSNDHYTMDTPANGNYDFDVAGIGQASDATNNTDAQGTGVVRINSASGLGNDEWLFWGHDNGPLTSYHVTDLPTGIQARLERVWRCSEVGDVGTVSLSIDLSTVAGAKTASDLRLLLDTDNDGAFNDETSGGGGVLSGSTHLGSGVYQWSGVSLSDGMRFSVGSIDSAQTPLPVELLNFEAVAHPEENVVYLFWVTAAERNNDYFTVEKSKDLQTYEHVAEVAGAGTTQFPREYEAIDFQPYNGVSYYRLSQTDFDNHTHTFPVKLVEFTPTDEVQMSLYPNPLAGGDQLFIRIPGGSDIALDLMVNDMLGREQISDVSSYNEGESQVLVIEFKERLRAGVYFVNVALAGESKTYKVQVR
jgi:hypothetical protein